MIKIGLSIKRVSFVIYIELEFIKNKKYCYEEDSGDYTSFHVQLGFWVN